ncbi:MAG: glycerophosphodiester phosphodiesterase family protein [Bacilli bacterium]|nr:glycerophosphodiester phosphodiesterase family protein [Bacilli bacterium]
MYNDKFHKKVKDKKVLIASHRGISGGSIIENTLPAFNLAIEAGADIIELDIIRSIDGVYYVYHDTEELRTLGFLNNIHTFSSKEIENFKYLNRYGLQTSQKIDRFEDVLQALKNRTFINLDRCYRGGFAYLKGALEIIGKHDMFDQVLVKTIVKEEILKNIEKYYPNILYMPIVSRVDQVELCEKYKLNIVALELLFANEDDEIISQDNLRKWQQKKYELWANAICIDENYIMSAGHNDNIAFTKDLNYGWGWLIDKGFTIIQTDWPYFLNKYLKERREYVDDNN